MLKKLERKCTERSAGCVRKVTQQQQKVCAGNWKRERGLVIKRKMRLSKMRREAGVFLLVNYCPRRQRNLNPKEPSVICSVVALIYHLKSMQKIERSKQRIKYFHPTAESL